MKRSRILGAFMVLLLLVKKVVRIKAAGRIREFFDVTCKLSVFRMHRFSALHGGELCGYLLWSCLLQRFSLATAQIYCQYSEENCNDLNK